MTHNRVLLPHPLEARLLMLHSHGEWRLPDWDDANDHSWHVTDHVNRAVAARFGMETTVLRCVRNVEEPGGAKAMRIYELDNHSAPHDMVPSATWIGHAEAAAINTDPETRELLLEWFGRDHGDSPFRGAPWTRRGWYVEALAWTVAQLNSLNLRTIGNPEQIRAWERSFLMRIRTQEGCFFFKASPAVLAHEAQLMKWLDTRYDENFADIVAVDPERGWFLQREVGAGALPLTEVREEEEWYRAVRRLADIQVDCTRRIRDLRSIGVPNRGLETLARRIPRLCADTAAMRVGENCGLRRAEADRIATLAPTLLALCEELASCNIPDSIEHGELSADNITSTLEGPVYLDWSDSSLSHPFFSLSQLTREAASLLPASSATTRRRIRDSYLAPWAVVAPYETLVRAFEIARVLAPVHHAATVHAELIPAAGYRWEFECAIPQHLSTALQLLSENEAPIIA